MNCLKLRPISHSSARTCSAALADAKMSRKRVQLSDLDRKKICQLAVEHKSLSQDKLTALLQTQLNKPELARSTVTGVLKERTKWLGLSDEAAGSKVRHRSAQWENL